MDREYFKVSQSGIRNIVESGGKAEDIAVFITISRYASADSELPNQLSTAGYNILSKATGLTRKKIKTTLDFLTSDTGCQIIEEVKGNNKSRSDPRFKIENFDRHGEVCLPNRLIDGYRKNYPLKKLLEGINGTLKLSRPEAKKYSLLMLLFLYKEHSYMPPDGIAPVSWFWESSAIENISINQHTLFRAENPQMIFNSRSLSGFIDLVEDEDIVDEVILSCIGNLTKAGLFYQAHLVVDEQPGVRGMDYLYKLYVKNQYVRDNYRYLSGTINSMVLNSELDTNEKRELVPTLESRRDEFLFVGIPGCQVLTLLYPNNILQQGELIEEHALLENSTKSWDKKIKGMYFEC